MISVVAVFSSLVMVAGPLVIVGVSLTSVTVTASVFETLRWFELPPLAVDAVVRDRHGHVVDVVGACVLPSSKSGAVLNVSTPVDELISKKLPSSAVSTDHVSVLFESSVSPLLSVSVAS